MLNFIDSNIALSIFLIYKYIYIDSYLIQQIPLELGGGGNLVGCGVMNEFLFSLIIIIYQSAVFMLLACYLLLHKYWCMGHRSSIDDSTADLTEITSDYTPVLLSCAPINLPMVFIPLINCHIKIKIMEIRAIQKSKLWLTIIGQAGSTWM